MTDFFSTLSGMLLNWTLLFALAWGVHYVLRNRHARWRQMLWRGVLVSAAAVALLPLQPLPRLHIFVGKTRAEVLRPLAPEPTPASAVRSAAMPAVAAPASASPAPKIAAISSPLASHRPANPFTGAQWLLILWGSGAAWGAIRLAVLGRRLRRLRKAADLAPPHLLSDMNAIRNSLRVRRDIDLALSPDIASPFLCGLHRPAILIPASLAEHLSREERCVLFAHELAHLQRNDLFWCTAWRVALAMFWFHPLAWKIPAAHELACEQEADRLASANADGRIAYARILAQFALRILAIAAPEPRLALGASSQISRRLSYLKSAAPAAWSRKKSAAAFSLIAALFLLAAGCELTTRKPVDVNAPVEFKKVLVTVHDESGKPIEGAVIQAGGFRVKGIHSPDAYGWDNKRFGPPVPATTSADGKAWLQYPVMGIPQEQELTGALFFNVNRDGFTTADVQTFYVDKPNDTVVMKRSGTLDVAAWFGPEHTPVTDVVANLSGGRPDDWAKHSDGHFVNARSAPGQHILQLSAKLPTGQTVFSEGILVEAQREKVTSLSIEMKPGIRVEGHIDAGIPRPIKNAHVFLSVRPSQYPVNRIVEDFYAASQKYGYMTFWHTYRSVNPDGTFTFESVPPGEADLVAVGDGFTSKSQGEFVNRMPDDSIEKWEQGVVIPQAFPLGAPVTAINLIAEPSATLEITTKDKSGQPIEGVQIFANPNIIRMPGGLLGRMPNSSESPFMNLDPLPLHVYTATTDTNGKATIPNLPTVKTSLDIDDPNYQAQVQQPNGWRDRYIRVTFSSGKTLKMDLTLEKKGADFLGLLH